MFTSLIEQMKYKTLIEETLCEIENIFNEERSIPSEITNIVNDIKYRLNDEVKKNPSLSYNRTELYRKLKMIYPKKRMVRFYSRIIII